MADVITIEVMPTYTAAAVAATKDFFSKSFGGAMSAVKSGAGAVGAVGGMAASGIGMATSAVTGPIGALGAVADLISKFTNAINPAVMALFEQAMQDIFAVVGQALLPAFEILTPAVQMMGDYIASILPNAEQMGELFRSLQPALDAVKRKSVV